MLISTVVKEDGNLNMRAEIHQTPTGYSILYYNPTGFVKAEDYYGKTLRYVEDAAENWAAGIKVLNG